MTIYLIICPVTYERGILMEWPVKVSLSYKNWAIAANESPIHLPPNREGVYEFILLYSKWGVLK